MPAPARPARRSVARPVAVALEDDGNGPRVVASGHGAVAEQILALAFSHGVKVRRDADLAELLAALDLDTEIPAEAMVVVAEILTRVAAANAGPVTTGASP